MTTRSPRVGSSGIARPLIVAAGGVAIAVAIGRARDRYRTELECARERLRSGSELAETACGPIEYAAVGEGIPVLEAHGVLGGFDQALAVALPLLGAGFRLIAPSRFGYLRSPLPPDGSPARQADAYAALLDHLGIERIAVMAHSAGSVSAIELALRHPERVAALVLVVPAAPGPGPAAPPKALMRALLGTDALMWTLATFFPSALAGIMGVPRGFAASEHERAEIARMTATLLPATARRDGFLFDMFVSAPAINSGLRFDEIAAPTLVVTARDDALARAANARALSSAIRDAELCEVARGGHLLLGQADVVGERVRRFISDHGARP